MGLPWQGRVVHWNGPTPQPMLHHICTGDTGRLHIKTVEFSNHNGAMPAIFSADVATDVARRLADALASPTLTAPFAYFGTHTMDAIQRLTNNFSVASTPTPTPTPPPSSTRAKTPSPTPRHNIETHSPPRVLPAVPKLLSTVPPSAKPPRVEPPAINSSHRYPLCSRTGAKFAVEAVGKGTVAFQGAIDPAMGKTQGYMQLICGPAKDTLTKVFSNDIVILVQGMGKRIKGTNTIFFIHQSAFPAGKRVPYGNIVVSIRTNKSETHRTRINVGGKRISYEGPTATQCAILITAKVIINSVVSNILVMFMCANICDFYYNTPRLILITWNSTSAFPSRNITTVKPAGFSHRQWLHLNVNTEGNVVTQTG